MMSCGTPRPPWFPRNWGLKESLRPLVELRHPCPPHLTQEPNSPLNGRPPRLLCTAVSPSSQTSGLLGSYSPSLSPKAECPTQVSDSDKKPQRFAGVQEQGRKNCQGGVRGRWFTAGVISFLSVRRRHVGAHLCRRMKWDSLTLSALVVYASAGGTVTHIHTHIWD